MLQMVVNIGLMEVILGILLMIWTSVWMVLHFQIELLILHYMVTWLFASQFVPYYNLLDGAWLVVLHNLTVLPLFSEFKYVYQPIKVSLREETIKVLSHSS